jgi:endonuclease G
VGIFSLILGVLYMVFNKFSGSNTDETEFVIKEDVPDLETTETKEIYYLPTSTTGDIVTHRYYALSYSEEHELPEWVSYELTRERLHTKWVDRTNDFRADPKVKSRSATPQDYKRSGYDRGHLAPAADMAFSEDAMSESFYMSNMSPQVRGFNVGVWRELEELTRDWAKKFHHLYVVSGPILNKPFIDWIGENEVAVPHAFYKVLLDLSEPELKGIAWVIPNEVTEMPLTKYATTIDEVEDLTGINFFSELMDEKLEAELEGNFDNDLWKLNSKKYELRVEKWNKLR